MRFQNETESDTRANRIDPILAAASGTTVPGIKVGSEVICPGRIIKGGKRGERLSADCAVIYRDQKLAVIEASRAGLAHTTGLSLAIEFSNESTPPIRKPLTGLPA